MASGSGAGFLTDSGLGSVVCVDSTIGCLDGVGGVAVRGEGAFEGTGVVDVGSAGVGVSTFAGEGGVTSGGVLVAGGDGAVSLATSVASNLKCL